MNIQHALAIKIANFLDAETAPDTKEKVLLTFGIEIFLNEFLKVVLILVLAALLGELFVVLLATTYLLLLRRYAGGRHCNTNFKCYVASIMTTLILPIIVINISLPYIVSAFLVVIELILVVKGLPQGINKKCILIVYCIGMIVGFIMGDIPYMNAMLCVALVAIAMAVDYEMLIK